MTVFKDPRTIAKDALNGAVAFLTDRVPDHNASYDNGSIDVRAKASAIVTVTRDTIEATLIDSGYYLATDFTGTWPGKP